MNQKRETQLAILAEGLACAPDEWEKILDRRENLDKILASIIREAFLEAEQKEPEDLLAEVILILQGGNEPSYPRDIPAQIAYAFTWAHRIRRRRNR